MILRLRNLATKLHLISRGHRPKLVVPPEFNRNSHGVSSLMSPEKSGEWLLERMRQRIGFEHYADKEVLDFGCGVRFSQAIINNDLAIGHYVGVDNFRAMIEFLQRNVRDDRFEYIFLDAYHPMYNPHGTALSPNMTLPLPVGDFDLACMFSVITHQSPSDSTKIFSLLRRHVKKDGCLFFTCFLDDSISTFEDRSPELNRGKCFYNQMFLTELVEDCGWEFLSHAPGEGPLIGDSFVFKAGHRENSSQDAAGTPN